MWQRYERGRMEVPAVRRVLLNAFAKGLHIKNLRKYLLSPSHPVLVPLAVWEEVAKLSPQFLSQWLHAGVPLHTTPLSLLGEQIKSLLSTLSSLWILSAPSPTTVIFWWPTQGHSLFLPLLQPPEIVTGGAAGSGSLTRASPPTLSLWGLERGFWSSSICPDSADSLLLTHLHSQWSRGETYLSAENKSSRKIRLVSAEAEAGPQDWKLLESKNRRRPNQLLPTATGRR